MDKIPFDIVRIEMRPEFGLYHWDIFGLNIFDYNDVVCPIERRPDVLFLTDLTARHSCAAHVGSLGLQDRMDAPEEMFGPANGAVPFSRTRIGFFDGFYDLNKWPCWDACFVPHITPLFWQALDYEENNLDQMLQLHCLAFYVSPRPDALKQMPGLLAALFAGEAQWLQSVTDLYGAVVAVGHDGQYLHAYAKNEEGLRLIEPSITAAAEAVEASEWFQSHKAELAWSEDPEDLNCCMMLPKQK